MFRCTRSSQWSAIMPRDSSCGSVTTSATVLIGPEMTPAADNVDDLRTVRGRCPVADDLVQLVLIAAARNVIDEPLVGREFRLAHRGAQPAEHRVLVGGVTTQLPSRDW